MPERLVPPAKEYDDEALIEEILEKKEWRTFSYRIVHFLRRYWMTLYLLPFLCSLDVAFYLKIPMAIAAMLADLVANRYAQDLDDRAAVEVIVRRRGRKQKDPLIPRWVVLVCFVLLWAFSLFNIDNMIVIRMYEFVLIFYFIFVLLFMTNFLSEKSMVFYDSEDNIDVHRLADGDFSLGIGSYIWEVRLLFFAIYITFLILLIISISIINFYSIKNPSWFLFLCSSCLCMLVFSVGSAQQIWKYQGIAKSCLARRPMEREKRESLFSLLFPFG